MKLELNEKELVYIKWHLLSNKMYKDMTLPHGVVLWEEVWMQPFLDKIGNITRRSHKRGHSNLKQLDHLKIN